MTRSWLGLAALATLAGCDDDAEAPSTLLSAPRLLAVAADPPVTTLDGAVALRALVVDGDGVELDVEITWRACSPWRPVRDPDVDCAPAEALPLAVDGAGWARLDLETAIARFGGPAVPIPPAAPCELDTAALPVIATAVIDGTRLIARKDVGLAAAARRAPLIATVTLDGEPASSFRRGTDVLIAATPRRESLDLRCTDDPEPVPVRESVRTFFYVTAGMLAETSADVVYQPDDGEAVGAVAFSTPSDVERLRLWTVMIDADGGAAWALRELTAR